MTWQTELRELVERVPAGELTDLVGELSRASALTLARLTRPAPEVGPPKRLLTAQQAGEYLGVSDEWCYAHKAELGAITLSAGAVRFPLKELDSFIARRPRAE
jgi:predicted DNA-binding transcriptional regulator AlpA